MDAYEAFIADRVTTVQETLAHAGTKYPVPRLIAVTKTIPVEKILPLASLGVTDIGENRAQEIVEKHPALGGNFRIHLIGRLQSNKVKYIIDKVCMIHSLDRISLAMEISKQATAAGICMPVLLQVNIAREAQKAGVPPEEICGMLRQCANLPGLRVKGLMAMMPLCPDGEALRPYFRRMREIFDQLRQSPVDGTDMEVLSMGMSQDYVIAAQEGATMVRVGSALFKG